MQVYRVSPATILTISIVIACLFSYADLAFAQTPCPPGEVNATAEDLPLMQQNGFPKDYLEVGNCWPKSGAILGEAPAKAKQELEQMWCGRRAARCGPYTSSMQELDPKFAVCAAAFITKIRAQDPSICIVSAYRSSQHQAYLCAGGCGAVSGPCAAAGSSKHQRGIAIDIEKPGNNTLPPFVHQMAQQGGGISFPVRNDDGHMEPNGGDCSTGGYIAPDSPASPYPQPAQTPAQSAMSSLQKLFTPPSPPQPQANPAAQALAQQPISAAFNPYAYISTTSATSVSGTNPVSSTVTPGSTNSSSGSPTPVVDLIQQIAYPSSTPATTQTTTTGSPIALNPSLGNAVALNGVQNSTSGVLIYATTNQNPASGQTFTSADLGQNSVPAYASNSTFAILENLKQTLLLVMKWLTPFGANAPNPIVPKSTSTVRE